MGAEEQRWKSLVTVCVVVEVVVQFVVVEVVVEFVVSVEVVVYRSRILPGIFRVFSVYFPGWNMIYFEIQLCHFFKI